MVVVPALIVMMYIYESAPNTEIFGIFISCATFLLLGLWDDSQNLKPITRLVVAIITVSLVGFFVPTLTIQNLTSTLIEGVVGLGVSGFVFTTICLVALANATNMADGRNGIVISMAMIWTGLAFWTGPSEINPLVAVLFFSLAITLYFNLRGHLYLGDSGSLSIGVLFGYLAIHNYNNAFPNIPMEFFALWFWVPVIDLVRLMVQRTARRRSPFSGDREHFHHLLYARFKPKIAFSIYLSLVAVPNLITVILPDTALAMIGIVTVIYAWICIASYRRFTERRATN